MADQAAGLSGAERRKQLIEQAKRRSAEKRGEVYDPAAEAAAEATKAKAQTEKAAAQAEPAAPARAEPKPSTAAARAAPPAATTQGGAAERVAAAKAAAAAKKGNGSASGAEKAAPKPSVAKPAVAASGTATAAESDGSGQAGINRREFLTYAWGATLGLLGLETGVATYFFMYPRFRAGEFGGRFFLGPASILPVEGALPDGNADGKFWLVNTDSGPVALYMVCTHLGCLYKWEPANGRFECPCHGSKFTREGDYIEGPAPRSLDQFEIEIVENGIVVSSTQSSGTEIVAPTVPSSGAEIVVNTGRRIVGAEKSLSPARAQA